MRTGTGGDESAIPIPPAVHSHTLRWGEMGDSLSSAVIEVEMLVVEVVASVKLNERRGDLGGGVGDMGEIGGESISSFAIQSVMSTSGSSEEFSVAARGSERVERVEREELREGSREKSRMGRWRAKGLSFGGCWFCWEVGLEAEGGMYPGVEVKLDSSSSVERRVVICDVRFSAALTMRVKIFGTERVSSGPEEVVLVEGFA